MRGVSNRRRDLSSQRVRCAVVETVERRLHLSSSQGRLLGSIPLTSLSSPTIDQTLVYNGRLYVVLQQSNTQVEQLWSIPTSGVGTSELIASGNAASGSFQYDEDTTGIAALTTMNGKLYFTRSGGGGALMATDGTAAGTSVISSWTTGSGLIPRGMAVLNNRLHYIEPGGGSTPARLRSSDGTPGGTSSYYSFPTGKSPYLNSELVVTPAGVVLFGGQAYDALSNPQGGLLWRTDGTAAGTSWLDSGAALMTDFTVAADRVYASYPNGNINGWFTSGSSYAAFDGSSVSGITGFNGAVLTPTRDFNTLGRHAIATRQANSGVLFYDADANSVTTVTAAATTRLASLSSTRAAYVSSGSLIAFDETTRVTTTLAATVPVAGTSVQVSGGRVVLGADSSTLGMQLAFSDGVSVAPMKRVVYTAGGELAGRLMPVATTVDGQPVYSVLKPNALQIWTADPNVDTGSVAVSAFGDATRDGVRQGFESGLAGTVYIDADGDGTFSTSAGGTTTSPLGFTLSDLAVGTYSFRFDPLSNTLTAAYPVPNNVLQLTLSAGATAPLVFTSPGVGSTVWGRLFNDLNANGVRESGEPFVSGGVYIDVNDNRLRESDVPYGAEPFTFAASDGTWGFERIMQRGIVRVRLQPGATSMPTMPSPDAAAVEVNVNAGVVELPAPLGVHTGPVGTVNASVYFDSNRNGVLDPGEPPVTPFDFASGGMTLLLDKNNDGTLNQYDFEQQAGVNFSGNVTFANAAPGRYRIVAKWTDRRYVMTNPGGELPIVVTLSDGASVTVPPILVADISGGGSLGGGMAGAPSGGGGPEGSSALQELTGVTQLSDVNAAGGSTTLPGAQLVRRANGTSVLVWIANDGASTTIRGRAFDDQLVPAGPSFSFGSPLGTASSLRAGVDAAGNVIAAWLDSGTPNGGGIRLASVDAANASRGAPLLVLGTSGTTRASALALTVRADGSSVVGCIQNSAATSRFVQLQPVAANLSLTGALRQVATLPLAGSRTAASPSLADAGNGELWLAWEQAVTYPWLDATTTIAVARLDASYGVTTSFTTSLLPAVAPAVIADPTTGGAVVGWNEVDPAVSERSVARVQWFDSSGVPTGGPVLLGTSGGSAPLAMSHVNASTPSDLVVAYPRPGVSGVTPLTASRVTRAGAVLNLFSANPTSTTNMRSPFVAADVSGGITIGWTGYGAATGNAPIVQARRIGTAGDEPQVASASFAAVPRVAPDNAPHRFVVQMERAISIASGVSATLVHSTRGLVLSRTVSARISANDPTRAEFLVTLPDGLPDGRYRLSIPRTMLVDALGNTTGSDIVIDATFMLGDATGDGAINFDDLLVLATNYNQSGRTTSQGDFSYDGTVNFDDLLILAARYNTSLSSAGIGALSAPPAGDAGADDDAQSPGGRWHEIDS
jgi:hypothetical protein